MSDINPYDSGAVARAQLARDVRTVAAATDPLEPDSALRKAHERLRDLEADNARLSAELAAIKERRCETCKHYTSWWPNSPQGSCFGFAKGLGCNRIASGFCDKWQAKEAADA